MKRKLIDLITFLVLGSLVQVACASAVSKRGAGKKQETKNKNLKTRIFGLSGIV
jgi:hypothetical protein